jgi:hypothetical protein
MKISDFQVKVASMAGWAGPQIKWADWMACPREGEARA